MAALAVVAFAANSLTARAALADAANDPFAFALVRLLAGAFILAAFARAKPATRDVAGGVALAVYMFGFAAAYTAMSTATGALILFSAVQITVLAISAARGEGLSALGLAGSALALAGLVFLLYDSLGSASPAPLAAMVTAGMAWGVYTVLGRGSDAPVQQTARQFLLASLIALPVYFVMAPSGGGATLTLQGVLLATLSGTLFSGCGYAVWYAVAPKLPAATIASVQLMTPVVAAAMGALFLREWVDMTFVIATLVILAGIAVTLWKPQASAGES